MKILDRFEHLKFVVLRCLFYSFCSFFIFSIPTSSYGESSDIPQSSAHGLPQEAHQDTFGINDIPPVLQAPPKNKAKVKASIKSAQSEAVDNTKDKVIRFEEAPTHNEISEPPVTKKISSSVAPSAPPSFTQRQAIDSYKCQREVYHQDRLLQCDSQLARDGQNLRPILSKTPSAIQELDIYQANRKRFNDLAYVGSLGIGIWWLGYFIASRMDDTTPENLARVNTLKSWSYYSGLGITGASFTFGVFSLYNNEKHLQKAIDIHNKTHPEDRLEIRFGTSFSF